MYTTRQGTGIIKKTICIILCIVLIFTHSTIYASGIDIGLYFYHNTEASTRFPKDDILRLRYLHYNPLNNFLRISLDNFESSDKNSFKSAIYNILDYLIVGIIFPNHIFWVNLRPDTPNNVIDEYLAKTEVGRILLESDFQLKKDTAFLTSPQTKEGREYWDKIYRKAEELFGRNIPTSLPLFMRLWIVPGEIIIRESENSAYIYKAALKVMVEKDYLADNFAYKFKDPRLKIINEYSTQLIRELFLPRITQEINNSERYLPLRQVYYALILAQWFKSRFYGKGGFFSWIINKKEMYNLLTTKKVKVDIKKYFKMYRKSFQEGEYNIPVSIKDFYGRRIINYVTGGINFEIKDFPFISNGRAVKEELEVWNINSQIISDLLEKKNTCVVEVKSNNLKDKPNVKIINSVSNNFDNNYFEDKPSAKKKYFTHLLFKKTFKIGWLTALLSFLSQIPLLAHTFIQKAGHLFVKVEKWHSSNPSENTLWGIARDILKANLGRNPSDTQILDKVNELAKMNDISNPNIIHQTIYDAHIREVTQKTIEKLTHTAASHSSDIPSINFPSEILDKGHQFISHPFWQEPYFLIPVTIAFFLLLRYGYLKIINWFRQNRYEPPEKVIAKKRSEDKEIKKDITIEENRIPFTKVNDEFINTLLNQWRYYLENAYYINESGRNDIHLILNQFIQMVPFYAEIIISNKDYFLNLYTLLASLSLETAEKIMEWYRNNVDNLNDTEKKEIILNIYEYLRDTDYFLLCYRNIHLLVNGMFLTQSYKYRSNKILGNILSRIINPVVQYIFPFSIIYKISKYEFWNNLEKIISIGRTLEDNLYSQDVVDKFIQEGWSNIIKNIEKDNLNLSLEEMRWKNRGVIVRFLTSLGLIYSVVSVILFFFHPLIWNISSIFRIITITFPVCTVVISWYVLFANYFNTYYKSLSSKKEKIYYSMKDYHLQGNLYTERILVELNKVEDSLKKEIDKLSADVIVVVSNKRKDYKDDFNNSEIVRKDIPVVYINSNKETKGSLLLLTEAANYLLSEEFQRLKENYLHLKEKNIENLRIIVLIDTDKEDNEEDFFEYIKKFTDKKYTPLQWQLLRGYQVTQELKKQNRGGIVIRLNPKFSLGQTNILHDITISGYERSLRNIFPNGISNKANVGIVNFDIKDKHIIHLLEKPSFKTIKNEFQYEPLYSHIEWDEEEGFCKGEITHLGRRNLYIVGDSFTFSPHNNQREKTLSFLEALNRIRKRVMDNQIYNNTHKDNSMLIVRDFLAILTRISNNNQKRIFSYLPAAIGGDDSYVDNKLREFRSIPFEVIYEMKEQLRFSFGFNVCCHRNSLFIDSELVNEKPPLSPSFPSLKKSDNSGVKRENLKTDTKTDTLSFYNANSLKTSEEMRNNDKETKIFEEKEFSGRLGGIDFRNIQQKIINELGNREIEIRDVSVSRKIANYLDSELLAINKLVKIGIRPSSERIKELLIEMTNNKDYYLNKRNEFVVLFLDIFQLEEKNGWPTESLLKEIFFLLEYIKDAEDLKVSYTKLPFTSYFH